jgi:TP901 family phage tail tape measure protein
MPVKAGAIEAEVRLSLKNMRKDVQSLDLLMKMNTNNFSKELNNISVYAERMQRKTGKTLKQYTKQIEQAQALFVKLYKSTSEDDRATREALAKTIMQLQEVKTKQQNYADLEAKRAVKRKEQAEQFKAIERANIAIAREKERVAKQNELAERQRHAKELEQQREKQAAYSRSLAGRVSNYLANLKFLATFKIMNRLLNQVAKSFRELVRVSVEYEASLANTQAVAQATAEGLNKLDEAAQKAGMTTKFTASEAAEGLYELASAGFDAYEATDALNGVLLMAAATSEGVADTAQLVAATIRQFRLEALEADRVANVLTASISTSQATMTKLKTSLTQAGTVAAGLNIPLEEMVGLLDLMYDSGMQASRAGRAMRNALAEMSNENSRTVKKLKEMGIAFEDIDLNTNSLVDAFGSLADSGLSTGQVMEAFGKVIGPQMMILVRSTRRELEQYVDRIEGTNRANTAAATQLDNLKGDLLLLKSAWQALGITLSKFWIPHVRSVVGFAVKLTRSINRLTSDIFGLTTESEKYLRISEKMATSVDEYKRLTDLMTNSTEKLTQAQKDLYAAELERSKFGIINALRELNNEYETQKENLSVIQSASDVTGMEKRRIQYYEDLGLALKSYDDAVRRYAHNEKMVQKDIGAKLGNDYYTAKRNELTRLEGEVMDMYSNIIYLDSSISSRIQSLLDTEGLSRQSKNALKDIVFFNQTLYDIPRLTDDEGIIRYAKSFNELEGVLEDAPLWRKWLEEAAGGSESYVNALVTVNDAINTIYTELGESQKDVGDVIEQTARYLNAEIIQEKDLLRYAPKLVDEIKNRAEELKKLGDVEQKEIIISAAAYEEMLKQLELSNEVRKSLDEDIQSAQDSINKDIEKSESMALITAAYELQRESAQRVKDTTIEEAQARKLLAEEELESKRQAEQSADAEEDLADAVSETAMESLQAAIDANYLNEVRAAEEARAFAVTQAEKALTLALLQQSIAQGELANERSEAYDKAVKDSDTYTKKLEDARDKELADYKSIVDAQGVFGISSIEENAEKRIEILREASARELEELESTHDEQEREIYSTYLERTTALKESLQDDLYALNEYYNLEKVKQENATALAIEELSAKNTMLLKKQEEYYNADIAMLDNQLASGAITQAEYDAKAKDAESKYNEAVAKIDEQHETDLADIKEQGANERLAIENITAKAIEDRNAEHTEAMSAEDKAKNDALTDNAETLSKEQIAHAEYTASEEKRIAEETADAKRDAWRKTINDLSKFVDETQGLLDAMLSLVTAEANAEIALIDRQLKTTLDTMDTMHETKMQLLEDEKDAALEAAGFRLDTERETLEKEIEEARRSADEARIIEAERALEKFEIEEDYRIKNEKAEKDYAARTEAAEKEAARKKGKLQYDLAMQQHKFGIAEIMLNTAKAVMQIWTDATAGGVWGKSAWTATALAMGGVQLAAAKAAKPVKDDFYATGGIVRGTPEGTRAIVGENNKTEAIFNPDQMANLLMAIAQGNGVGGSSNTTFIFKNMYDKEVARYVIDDCVNNGVYLIDPKKGIKKVAR